MATRLSVRLPEFSFWEVFLYLIERHCIHCGYHIYGKVEQQVIDDFETHMVAHRMWDSPLCLIEAMEGCSSHDEVRP